MKKRSTTCSERVVFVSNYWGCLSRVSKDGGGRQAPAGPSSAPLKATSFPYAFY
jgi:hypothetical protein